MLGRDGLYLEARNAVLELRIKVADSCIPLPYGTVANSGVHLRHGKIPVELLNMAKAKSRKALPNEWAGYVVWDGVNLAKLKDAMGDNTGNADVGVIWFQESPPHVTFTHKNGHP